MSSEFGDKVKISIFGQSHSKAIGVVIDGLPAGEKIDMDELNAFLKRRAPGSKHATARKEEDMPEFISGLLGDVTCGAPLCAVIQNNDARPGDYEKIRDLPRPSHADFSAFIKYGGFNDVRGGGHFSGRLTAPLCVAGGIAMQILEKKGIAIGAHIASIGDIHDDMFDAVDLNEEHIKLPGKKEFCAINDEAGQMMIELIQRVRQENNSVGGVVECAAVGLPVGIGDPMFDGVENVIAKAVFAIPAVKGLEFGAGFKSAAGFGDENNDRFYRDGDKIRTKTNNSGGILGGITNSMPVILRVAFKPTPSIAREQDTVNLRTREDEKLTIEGRHDPCIVVRAVPCVEAAVAIALINMI